MVYSDLFVTSLLIFTELTSYQLPTQPRFTCSMLTMETPEQGVESA